MLAGALAVVLAASVFAGAATYKDGTYFGWSDGDRYGYLMAIVTVQNDKIVNVMLTEFNHTGTPKDASYPWAPFHEAMKELPGRFIAANSADIDGFTQATGTTTKAKQAVARALDKALVNKGSRKYQDGTFYGISTDSDRSTGVAWVTIKDDKIVKVELDEFLEDGSWKDWSTYPWKEVVEGRAVMAQRFVDAQGVDVDTITAATGSSVKWIQAVQQALMYATR